MNQSSKPDAFRQIFTGGDLLDQSKAKPSAFLDWEKIESKLAASRSATKSQPQPKYNSDTYLKQCREEDPWPEEQQEAVGTLSLSDCRFAFPASLFPDRDALVQCNVSQADPPAKGSVTFKLWVRTEGELDWMDLSETTTTPVEAKAGGTQLEAKLVLHCPTPPPPLGTKLEYRVTAEETGGSKAESAPTPVVLQNFAQCLGAPHLSWKDRRIAPVLDEDGKWALGLAALLKTHAERAGGSLVAFGFARGQSARDLGKYRAEWLRCVLSRDKSAWETLRTKMDTMDLQAILSGLCLGFDWNSDPGAVDGKMGIKTVAAIKGFQSQCEARLGVALKPDGEAGKKTWEALLDAICCAVGQAMGDAEGAAPSWPVPVWGHSAGKGVYSNGGDIARGDEAGAEVLVFEPGMEPLLTVPSAGKKIDATLNPTEDPAVFRKVPIFVSDPQVVPDRVRRVRMVGMIFDANKGFVLPQALPGIKKVVDMHKAFPQAKMLVVGHAESDEIHAGIDLAHHRAEMLTAYLVGKIEPWLACFGPSQVAASRWGTREIQLMLSALDNDGKPFFEGCASGLSDEKTKNAIKVFQKSKALKDDGIVGPKTREALVRAYLDIEDTTVTHDDIPLPHGCEGHPDGTIVEAGLVEDDRRVEVFFFEKKIKPRPRKATSHEADSEYVAWTAKLEETQDFEVHGVHVRVVDDKKKAVASLPVKLVGPVELDSVTDQHGYASFVGLKAGSYALRSAKDDHPIPLVALKYPTAKTVAIQ